MKTNILPVLALLCATSFGNLQQAQAQTLQVISDIQTGPTPVKIYQQWPHYGLVDTATMHHGRLTLTLPKDSHGVYALRTRKPFIEATFFADTSLVEIHILGDSSTIVKGSKLLGRLHQFEASMKPFEKKWSRLGTEYEQAKDLEEKLRINQLTNQMASTVEQKRLAFSLQNKDNIAGAFVAYKNIYAWHPEALELLAKAFEGKDWAAGAYNGLMKKQQELASSSMLGTQAPNFTLRAPNGASLRLDSIYAHHKYVVLDFWASWCAPCRATNRNFAPLYQGYQKKGIAFISLSVDTDKDAWVKAIKADKIPWLQVVDTAGIEGVISKAYKIKSLPSTFLMDQNGKIIAQNLTKEDLDKL